MAMQTKPDIEAHRDSLVAWRHDFHRHPEIGFEERRTSGLVAERLAEWGIEVARGVGGTGVVGTIHGRRAGNRAIGLRADMDALPIVEANGFAHASTAPGTMHACGHDGHTTMLLGAARYLAASRDFAGTVHLIFQPAEEGLGGADAMIADGLFERFEVDAIYAVHNAPQLPLGSFALRPTAMMAAADVFAITIEGRGGHAAMPQLAVDPIVVAGQMIGALQTLVSRALDPIDSAVVTVGSIHGGSAFNIIPDRVALRGTVRTLSASARDLLERRLREVAEHVAAANGARAVVAYTRLFPVLENTADETAFAAETAAEIFGAAHVDAAMPPVMGSEDFAVMLQHRPGAYAMIGQGDGGQHSVSVHNAGYEFNDAILTAGASYLARLVERALPG
jgi:amidohydrolase